MEVGTGAKCGMNLIEFVITKFFDYFSKTAKGLDKNFFDRDYESNVKAFLDKCDKDEIAVNNTLEMDILNSNFTIQEVKGAIDYLRSNKAPGCDNIPAGSIKYCKELVEEDLTTVLNYIIELRDFPEIWAEGLRSVKIGSKNAVKNYRTTCTKTKTDHRYLVMPLDESS